MNKIFAVRNGEFELILFGDKDEQLHKQFYLFPVKIELRIGGLSAVKKIEFEISALEIFHKDLQRVYDLLNGSTSRLETLDKDFSVVFESNELGQIIIEGDVYEGNLYLSNLKFRTQIDQSYIPRILKELNEFIQER